MASGCGSDIIVCILALIPVEFQLTSSSKDITSVALAAWLLRTLLAGSIRIVSTYVSAMNAVNDASSLSPFMPFFWKSKKSMVSIEKEIFNHRRKEKKSKASKPDLQRTQFRDVQMDQFGGLACSQKGLRGRCRNWRTLELDLAYQ